MSILDTCSYVLFQNPLSAAVINSAKQLGSVAANLPHTIPGFTQVKAPESMVKLPKNIENLVVDKILYSGSAFVKLAGLSGAVAVGLGAYGAHHLLQKPGNEERKRVYETANRYHFYHTIALIGVPMSRHPNIAGALMTSGMVLFCGSCYYDAFTGDPKFRKFAPLGGSLLIIGWLAMIF